MNFLKKSKTPNSFVEWLEKHKNDNNLTYESIGSELKQVLREQLCKDQGYVCAYCQQRIFPNQGSMKIEHWRAQSTHPDEQLDWKNMLGVCLGKSKNILHCDTSRGNKKLHYHPANPNHRPIYEQISYAGDGRICLKRNENLEKDLKVLNLNAQFLRENRVEALDQVISCLKTWRLGLLKKMKVKILADDGKKDPFYGFVLYHLNRWIRKKEGK